MRYVTSSPGGAAAVMAFGEPAATSESTLVETLFQRANDAGGPALYTFLADDGKVSARITCAELIRKSTGIAQAVNAVSAPGDRVLLLCPPGPQFLAAFVACLVTGRIAVPVHVTPSVAGMGVLAGISADCAARVAIAPDSVRGRLADAFAAVPRLRELTWVSTEAAALGPLDPYLPSRADVAFLQYTSGSTGAPKGVAVTHGNLMSNLDLIERAFGHTAASRGVIWLPPYHDMGLIGGMLQPLFAGFPVTLMSPRSFVRNPLTWLRTIAETGATTSGGPTFAYDLCVSRISAEQAAGLDLSRWQVAFVGAEPVRAAVLDRFARHFAASGFRRESFLACYGLAESTLFVSGTPRDRAPRVRHVSAADLENGRVVEQPDGRAIVSSGVFAPGTVAIVDPHTCLPLPAGRVGEVWLTGDSVAQGYWNATAERSFGIPLAGQAAPGYLRTGDLGFLLDGELHICGRSKELIIINGRNIFPPDIEDTVAAVATDGPARGRCAVFSVDHDGAERLIVMQEIDAGADAEDRSALTAAIRDAVARTHQLAVSEVMFVDLAAVPRTTSGKTQRRAARAMFLADRGAGDE